MIIEKYTMVEATHIDPEYDVFFFVTVADKDAANKQYGQHTSVMWVDQSPDQRDGILTSDLIAGARLQRDYEWVDLQSKNIRYRAMFSLFKTIFNSSNKMDKYILKDLVGLLKQA